MTNLIKFREQLAEDENSVATLGLPSYLTAADSHSIANNNQTFLEGAAETATNIPKFIGVSMLSGANQFYNILPSIGNVLGGDFELSSTAEVISDFDDDLGKYYEDHQQSADTVGFILSSLVPGMAGVRILNAGQKTLRTAVESGRFGKNMSSALGLLAPIRERHLSKAIKEITNSNSLSLLTNRNTMRAMASGFGQATLEAAAFEMAVVATLHESPVLEEQDVSDIITNIAVGGLVLGTIGGVVDITKASFAVKNAVKDADRQAAPWTHINVLPQSASPSNKILYDLEQFHNIPKVPLVFDGERLTYIQSAAKEKGRRLTVQVRNELGNLTKGDQDVADQMFAFTLGQRFEAQLGNYLGATNISRLKDLTKSESMIKKIDAKIKAGTASFDEVDEINKLDIRSAYMTSWGERMGNVVDDVPQHLALADNLKKGQSITVKGNVIKAGKEQWKFKPPTAKSESWDNAAAGLKESQARHIWALESKPFNKTGLKEIVIGDKDLPLLEKAYREFSDIKGKLKIRNDEGKLVQFSSPDELLDLIRARKEGIAVDLLQRQAAKSKSTLSQEDIASMLNVRSSYLSGEVSDDISRDLFALTSYAEDYTTLLVEKGLRKESDELFRVYTKPRTVKMTYDTSVVKDIDGNVLEGMEVITEQARLQQQATDVVTNAYFGDDVGRFIELSTADVLDANRTGAGAKLLTAASSNYGSLAAKTEWLGKVTSEIIQKKQGVLRDKMEPLLYKLATSQDATIEWSTLNARLRAIPDHYVINNEGTALVPAAIKRYEEALAVGKEVSPPVLKAADAPLEIPIKNKEVLDLAKAHIENNGTRLRHTGELRAAQGIQSNRDPDVFYPMPINPKDYPNFGIVVDNSITGTGHKSMLYAHTEKELEMMKAKLADQPNLMVLTGKDAEEYYKSIGQFDNTKTLSDNYIDAALHRKGISAPYFVPTDGKKVTTDFLEWHLTQETSVVREMVSAKYERQFEELRRRGDQFTKLATSTFSSAALVKRAENVVKNPYMDYIKTSLGLRNYQDYPFWVSMNRMVDKKVSEMYDRVTRVVEGARTSDELSEVNSLLRQYGYKGAAYDMEMDFLANHTAPRGALLNFVQKANAILATTVLRLDFLNAANNYIAANILFGAESKAIIRAIESSDTNAVGELAKLGKIKLPGTDDFILSPTKLLERAYRKFGTDTADMKFFKEQGYVTNISDQYRWTLDNLTLNGHETVRDLNSKITKVHDALRNAADKGERWTGNRLAEEFNRFAAASTMKDITDIAVKHGLMDEKTALSYINTFVNRTQGNYLAAQRPMLFQGALGQSIGLFQTYQFNLMQQLLRHVGEGAKKDAATLLGLQGTIYGLNGLPAFNAINTHIVGNASGNTEHRDFYTTVYGAAGKDAGDWLMYGFASNMLLHPDLKTNLYVRGDINPRHVTVVPTNPADVPIVQAYSKFFGNLKTTAQKLGNGGDVWTTLLQGIEHNGISRPLAGIAQTLEGLTNPEMQSFSTSKRGNIIASNDLYSLANISRMVGGKPLGEAVAVDASFRFKAYALKDSRRRSNLGKAIKTTMIGGKMPTQDQVDDFLDSYVGIGGKQTEFNKWMMQLYKEANTSQANELARKLESPHAQSMQTIMGGYELNDFSN